LLVLHTINNETRTALREAKNVGSGSRLLARIARLMKDYDDADRARFDEHRKRTIPASELARAKDELDYNRLNVAADDKLFADALHAVDDMPDSRYRQKILDILYQPFRGPGSPIRYRSNAAGPWLTRVHHTPQRRRPGNG
jgi:hypothetical protein